MAATAVAVWVGVIKTAWSRPKLSLHYQRPSVPDTLHVPENETKPGKATLVAYNYLTVENAPRRNAATDVQVFVKEVEVLESLVGGGGEPGSVGLGDLAHKWSNSEPRTTRTTVAPGTPRRLDFLRVLNRVDDDGRLPLIVDVFPEQVGGRNHVRGRELRFELLVTASNADAQVYTVVVQFDGRFPAETPAEARQLWEHLTIKRPRAK